MASAKTMITAIAAIVIQFGLAIARWGAKMTSGSLWSVKDKELSLARRGWSAVSSSR
jgi:hypothetical protein